MAGAEDRTLVRALGITHFLTVGDELVPPETYPALHVSITDLPWMNILDALNTALCYMNRVLAVSETNTNATTIRPRKLLVHCFAGASRSASLIIAHHMHTHPETLYDDALIAIRSRRSAVRPNMGFAKQLKVWGEAGCSVKNMEVGTGEGNGGEGEEKNELANVRKSGMGWDRKSRTKVFRNKLLRQEGLLEDLDWG